MGRECKKSTFPSQARRRILKIFAFCFKEKPSVPFFFGRVFPDPWTSFYLNRVEFIQKQRRVCLHKLERITFKSSSAFSRRAEYISRMRRRFKHAVDTSISSKFKNEVVGLWNIHY